jgi:hypothetical protein
MISEISCVQYAHSAVRRIAPEKGHANRFIPGALLVVGSPGTNHVAVI